MRILHIGDDFAALRPCGLTLYAEALMDAQARRGHDVAYVFSGRHYPRLQRPRLKRWKRGDVAMYELIGSPLHAHWETGTRQPLRDLADGAGEAAVRAAIRESAPDVVHIHELARLPSSVIEEARQLGVPVVMTLHDYKPVCASVRLLDADGQVCLRSDVGEDCSRNCAQAPQGPAHIIAHTMRFEEQRAKRLKGSVPLLRSVDLTPAAGAVGALRRLAEGRRPPRPEDPTERHAAGAPAEEYQTRRDVNLGRLGMCDLLIAPSRRVAEVYAQLGVDSGRIRAQRLAVPHIERLYPAGGVGVGDPVRFVTLGGCAHPSKGSRMITEAAELLVEAGLGGAFRLAVHGHIEPAAAQRLARVEAVDVMGPYGVEDLDRLLDDADVGVLPSTWEEAHGFVGIEMLAKGLPLVANAIGGIPEYVRDGETGWLNGALTARGLADLMAAAIADPAAVERAKRAVRAQRAAIVRPMAAHLAELDDAYAEVLSARSR